MRAWLPYLLTSFTALVAIAEPSDFEIMMNHQSSMRTREEIVRVGKDEYRRIMIKDREFFLRLPQQGDLPENIQVICEDPQSRQFFKSASMTVLKTQLTERTQAFISVLQASCTEEGRAVLVPVPRLGLIFADSKNGLIKDRKLYLNLLSQSLGFAGTW